MSREGTGETAADRASSNQAIARLGALFDTHQARLYRLARRLAQSQDEAKDLVQETFLRAARTPASVPVGMPSEEAWLVRVLVNLCRDEWRKNASRRRLHEHYPGEIARVMSANHENSFVAHSTVWRALQHLTPRRRAAIVLYELEDADIPSIARLLGISAITVRWHLSRGRKELANIITGQREGTS